MGYVFTNAQGRTDARLRIIMSRMNRIVLENLIHRIFGAARLDIEIQDRFGRPVRPKEWFLVPSFIIDEAVARIEDQSILEYQFDPKTMAFVKMQQTG